MPSRSPRPPSPPIAERSKPAIDRLAPFILIAIGMAAFANSFGGVFLLDDGPSILQNARVHRLWPLPSLHETVRPVIELTFAINYALGGSSVTGYHAVNLAIHLAAGRLLFGLIRRTLRLHRSVMASARATWIALFAALLWLVHPLQTQSVTYISQRAEALAGLWLLLILYALARSIASSRPQWCYGIAVAASALGMATKPTMVVAPIIALLYDRVFLTDTWPRRRWLHASLVSTWLILAWLLATQMPTGAATAGSGVLGVTPMSYLSRQPGAIGRYLRLAVWPKDLVLDYGGIIPGPPLGWVTLAVGALTLWLCWRRPRLGFLGAWFLLTLLPTSSVIPIQDVIAEHRMYLPLAAVTTALALAIDALSRRLRPIAVAGVVSVMVGMLSFATIARNRVYHSALAMWQDVVAKQPLNARAQNNLGIALARVGLPEQAALHYEDAVRLWPEYADPEKNLGNLYTAQGHFETAVAHYERALAIDPRYAEAHNDVGVALAALHRTSEAMIHYREALRLQPSSVEAHTNLANLLLDAGQTAEAWEHYAAAAETDPDNAFSQDSISRALARDDLSREAFRLMASDRAKLADALAQYQQIRSRLGMKLFGGPQEEDASLGRLMADYGKADHALRQALGR